MDLRVRRGWRGERVVPFDATRKPLIERVSVMQATPVTMASGWWMGMLMQDREDKRKAALAADNDDDAVRRSKDAFTAAVEWAASVGFAPEQRPLAASAALTLRSSVGERRVTKQMVLDRCRALYPDIFGCERVMEQAA